MHQLQSRLPMLYIFDINKHFVNKMNSVIHRIKFAGIRVTF